MSSRRSVRQLLVAVLLGVLVGGGLMAVTPAGAEVSKAAATSWKKIWKKELKPLADKRYYTKKQSDAAFSTKAETAASNAATDSKLGGYYKKTESDAKYATAGSGYTKAESDAKYAQATQLVRGNVKMVLSPTAVGQVMGADISFGSSFATAPTVHVIPVGGVPPAGCSGTVTAPDAAPGNLCIFASLASAVNPANTCKVSTASCFGSTSDPWGASIFTSSTAASGTAQYFATWAARPTGIAVAGREAPAPSGRTGTGVLR